MMNIRWSDFVALSAIAAGAIVPTALLWANRSQSDSQEYHVIRSLDLSFGDGVEFFDQDMEGRGEALDQYRTTFEIYEECVERAYVIFADEDATTLQVRFLEEQVALQENEIARVREATSGVRDRVVGDIAATRVELALKPSMDPVQRQEFLKRASEDLVRMAEAETLAEQAMAEASHSLQERLILINSELSAQADEDQGRKRRHRRKGPPCRRPPTRRPGRRHPGR